MPRKDLRVVIKARGEGGMQSVETASDCDGGARSSHPVEEGGHRHCNHQCCSFGEEKADVDQNGTDFFIQVLKHQSFLTTR